MWKQAIGCQEESRERETQQNLNDWEIQQPSLLEDEEHGVEQSSHKPSKPYSPNHSSLQAEHGGGAESGEARGGDEERDVEGDARRSAEGVFFNVTTTFL
ncbi:hypothetical protein YC2023_057932 [Brassica napus]